ncbi:MAG TPA: lipid II flippase MurJ [Candidatus Angelobacter sp.]|nr:lipid II flippase MurJ [Candidatus Angelobacter sp.]
MNFNLFRKSAPDTTNRKIFRAALIVGFLGLIAKLAATLKELIIARSFGRGDEVDAFLIAFLLPSFVLNIGMSALGYALVPVFVEARQKGGVEAAQRLLSSIMLLGCVALIGVAAVIGLLAPLYLPLLGHSFSPAKLDLTRELLYLLLPWIVFSGVATLSSSVLNAIEKFALPALIPLLTPLVTIYFVVFHAHRWGIFTLAGGFVIGGLLEASLLLALLKKHNLPFSLRWYGLDARVRGVLAQYVPMLGGAILMGSTAVVDQSMAAILPSGNVAALGYANKLIGSVLSIGALALSSATLPYFSSMVAAHDWAGCRHTIKRYSLLVAGTTVPFTLLVITFSRPIVRIFFQRGAFTAADTELVSWVQICYAIQIPFFIWSILFVRFISAIRRNDVLMYVSAINLGLDIVLNLLFMRVWHVAGIALSTSMVYIASFLMISIWSVRYLAQERSSSLPVAQAETSR